MKRPDPDWPDRFDRSMQEERVGSARGRREHARATLFVRTVIGIPIFEEYLDFVTEELLVSRDNPSKFRATIFSAFATGYRVALKAGDFEQ
jgi:hypothetical protein